MHLIFSHGKESGPEGRKINALRRVAESMGCSTAAIDYRAYPDVTARVTLLLSHLQQTSEKHIILVGSSMGAYVSIVAAEEVPVKGLFLMAPAVYLPNYPKQQFELPQTPISIVHGWNDEIVPYEKVVQFGASTKARLHLVADGHRLVDSLEFLEAQLQAFIQALL